MPNRAIFTFDRQLSAHPQCVPDGNYFILGDFENTLPAAPARIGGPVALCHADIGSGDERASRALASTIAPMIDRLMAAGGVVLGDQPMLIDRWAPLPLPEAIEAGRYFLYRVG